MAQETVRRLNILDPIERQIFIQQNVPRQSDVFRKRESSLVVPFLVWPTVGFLLSFFATIAAKQPSHEVFPEFFDRPKDFQVVEITSIDQGKPENFQAGTPTRH